MHGPVRVLLAALLIVVVTSIAYASSFRGAFLFDDVRQIVGNASLRQPDVLQWLLTKSDRPLVDATFALNVSAASGPPDAPLRPAGFHTVNFLIHIGAALTLLGIIRRTLLLPRFAGRFHRSALPIALSVAAAWAVHPLQTQAVTYIVQRGESLMGLCYLLTLYCYMRGALAARKKHLWYIASILLCAAGMASKAVMVTAPLLIALYDRCLLTTSWRETFKNRWPALLGLAFTWSILFFLGIGQEIFASDVKRASVGFSYKNPIAQENTWWHYFLTQPAVILHYLRLSLWPSPLILDYHWPLQLVPARAMPALFALALLGLATLWLLWKKTAIGFLAAAFFIILAPTSSIIPVKDAIFEHRMYLPLAAVLTLFALAVVALLRRWWTSRNVSSAVRRLVVVAPMLVLVSALVVATYLRNLDYRSAEIMWRDVISKQPGNLRAMNNLAKELIDQAGRATDAQTIARLREEACGYFQTIIELNPVVEDLPLHSVQYNLANCFVRAGDVNAALPLYEAAVTTNPRFLQAQIMYGNALSRLNMHEEAAERFRIAAANGRPIDALLVARAHYNRGNELLILQRVNEAIDAYNLAAQHPQYVKAWYQIGNCWNQLGDADRARHSYQTLLQYMPDHAAARQKLQLLNPR